MEQRPIFLSGKVVLDNGTPPPEPVTIERVCNGNPRPEGYTDSKGRFSFQLGQRGNVLPDASVNENMDSFGRTSGSSTNPMGGRAGVSERELMNCELRASLPGYRSQAVSLAGRRVMDNPDVGTIVLHRIANIEGLTVSATSALAPKDAKKAYEKGREQVQKQKWSEAQASFEKAVEVYPKYAMAWNSLGSVHAQQNKIEEARKAYQQAIAADSKLVQPYMELAILAAKQNQWDQVAEHTAKVIRLDPIDYPQAYYFDAAAKLNLGQLDEAEKSARQGLKMDDQHRIGQMEYVLGLALAQKRDFAEAAKVMQAYLTHNPKAGNADLARKQLAEVQRFLNEANVSQKQPE